MRRPGAAGLAAACALGVAWLGCSGQDAPRVRSVVLVVVDTLRADHLGLYGYPRQTSPALDRWAGRAAVFDRAFAQSSWTLPSFVSLYTGEIPSRHAAGFRILPEGAKRKQFAPMDPSLTPLGEILAGRGFATAGIANNPFLLPGFGFARGFETWDYVFSDYLHYPRGQRIVRFALRWLDRRDERPFLLALHFMDPHTAYDPPKRVRGRFTKGYTGRLELPLDGFGNRNPKWRPRARRDRRFVIGAYDEEVLGLDGHLGRLLAGLEERGVFDEALVILTADHGEELFEHGGFEHGHSMFQEVVRVPLLVWGPGVEARRLDAPVSLIDLMPTALEALGLEAPEGLAGRSLWPLLTGGEAPAERPIVLEGTLRGVGRQALVRWPWKLIASAGSPPRLYHLERDPGERRDLARRERARVEALASELDVITRRAAAARVDEAEVDLDESALEQLRGLGYVE